MKKYLSILLALCLLCVFAGCAEKEAPADEKNSKAASQTKAKPAIPDFIDLTKLSSTLLYAEVYNIMNSPGDYIGKTIKISGAYSAQYYEPTDKVYHAVLIADAAACCSSGIEFAWSGEHSYPDDYPEVGSKIEVTGVFGSYEELGQTYYFLTTDGITAL